MTNYIEIKGRMPDGKTERIIRVDKEGRIIPAEAVTETFHPFAKGPLTTTGVQWSTEYNTTAAVSIYETVEEVRCNTMLPGTIQQMELGLTCGIAAATAASADMIYRWQARSVGKNDWATLATSTETDSAGTTIVESTYSGYFATIDANGTMDENCSKVPIDLRFQIQCDVASEGQGKTKNSSYAKITYIPD